MVSVKIWHLIYKDILKNARIFLPDDDNYI